MRRFLVLFDQLEMRRESVKSGRGSPEAITAARCVNVGLFVSGGLRRDVTVSLSWGHLDNLNVVSFSGTDLRRVSPDERSISFFLLKASELAARSGPNEVRRMDNGVRVERSSLESLVDLWNADPVYIADHRATGLPPSEEKNVCPLIVYGAEQAISNICDRLPNGIPVFRPPHPERLILDVNMQADAHQIGS